VVEFHLVWLEGTAAVLAWHSPKVAEEFDHASLSNADTLHLEVAISCVVIDVLSSLAATRTHS
jgi:hypothetical protein